MFVTGELRAEVSFAVARAQLARLARAGGLLDASQGAYGAGLAGLVPADPPGWVPQVAGLVRVHVGNLIARGDAVRAPLRWEAIVPGGGLFPVLDADLTLRPAGEQATTLTLTGVYRLPPGTQGNGLGQAVVRLRLGARYSRRVPAVTRVARCSSSSVSISRRPRRARTAEHRRDLPVPPGPTVSSAPSTRSSCSAFMLPARARQQGLWRPSRNQF